MNRQDQYKKHQAYIEENGLHKLIDFGINADYQENVFDAVSGNLGIPFPPEPDDLVRLHRLIRMRKSFTVLEFGLGYSTVVIADALEKNQRDWESLSDAPSIRNRHMFQVFSVDASAEWIDHMQNSTPLHLRDRIHLQHSPVKVGTFRDQLCHYYDHLPDVVADFMYLDGPAAKDVQGELNGMSFQCDERTVMSGDLLRMESTFLPGTFILVDGRTNNARFLQRNFQREYDINWNREEDVTTFELKEERLGRHNLLGTDFY